MVRHRRMAAVQLLSSLQPTDDQRRIVLEQAKAAQPIVEAAKAETRRIVAQAWAQATSDLKDGKTVDRKALRESVKTQLQALRDKTRGQIEPLAKQVVASLTPEQRQKIQDAAGKRGKTVDDAKLTRLASHIITRPMTIPFLEAKLGR
jgi:hypothetical protein